MFCLLAVISDRFIMPHIFRYSDLLLWLSVALCKVGLVGEVESKRKVL